MIRSGSSFELGSGEEESSVQPTQMIPQRRRDIISPEEEMLAKQNNRYLVQRDFANFSPMNEDYIVYVAMSSGVI